MSYNEPSNLANFNMNLSTENILQQAQSTDSSHLYLIILFSCVYALLGSFSICMNTIVIVALVRTSPAGLQNNITNLFVLILAVSDLLLCGVNLPLQSYYELSVRKTRFGLNNFLCKVVFAYFGLPMYLSCLTILLIAIDRFSMILYPLRPRMSAKMATMLIVVIGVFSVLSSSPVALFVQADEINLNDILLERAQSLGLKPVSMCVEHWPVASLRLAYSLYIFCVLFLVPLMTVFVLYTRIFLRLRQRTLKSKAVERKRRTNKILTAIVVAFALCWSPHACRSLHIETHIFLDEMYPNSTVNLDSSPSNDENHFNMVEVAIKILPLASGCLNPLLYGCLNETIRKSINELRRHVLCCCCWLMDLFGNKANIVAPLDARNHRHLHKEDTAELIPMRESLLKAQRTQTPTICQNTPTLMATAHEETENNNQLKVQQSTADSMHL